MLSIVNSLSTLFVKSKDHNWSDKLTFLINLPKTIYFNFYYLPFHQAIKLPILLANVKLKKMGGNLIIDSKKITTGMIRFGKIKNTLYEVSPNKFMFENNNTICFKGSCRIGHNSALTVGKNGYLEFGNNFVVGTTLRIACYKSIIIGENTRLSWENILTDTDFHETIEVATGKRSIPSKEIIIGKNNWIGIRTLILKGTKTPDFCIVGAGSLLNKPYDFPPYSLVAGNPVKLIKTGVYRDLDSFVE